MARRSRSPAYDTVRARRELAASRIVREARLEEGHVPVVVWATACASIAQSAISDHASHGYVVMNCVAGSQSGTRDGR
jgi:hypothetical protein